MSIRHYLYRAPSLSAAEAIEAVRAGALIVDVRRGFEWHRTRIPGAAHLPLEQLTDKCAELPDDRLLITFCTGGLRSYGAANLLIEYGFEAKNMSGGLIDWRAAGGALEPGR
ncbi:rhodanese-like domain-containing protein [Nocardia flavorosea]|uniref:Rhodanese-like domain-containing protein n=1 Tax=Nocardia flavorosea TaxID=53429 RepID=A0A846YBI3_9NOCA|nr:rhodanese-like domain-containing protein [Nocardia flavorosea]NKY55150.1 rhodanese-like domain-containing protein [Nocardia flavorosea]